MNIKWSKSEKEGRTYWGFDHILGTSSAPLNSSGVALAKDGDEIAVDNELAVLGLIDSLEPSVHGVVHVHLAKSSSVEFGKPMYGVKRRKRTIYLWSMKGLPKSVEHALTNEHRGTYSVMATTSTLFSSRALE